MENTYEFLYLLKNFSNTIEIQANNPKEAIEIFLDEMKKRYGKRLVSEIRFCWTD